MWSLLHKVTPADVRLAMIRGGGIKQAQTGIVSSNSLKALKVNRHLDVFVNR